MDWQRQAVIVSVVLFFLCSGSECDEHLASARRYRTSG
jgi:hypothetical protein